MAVTIQPILLKYIIEDMSARFDHAIVNIDRKMERYPIHNTFVSGSIVRKYVYIQDSDAIGKQILEVSLMDKAGNVIASQPMKISKGDKGFLIGFEFVVEVKTNV